MSGEDKVALFKNYSQFQECKDSLVQINSVNRAFTAHRLWSTKHQNILQIINQKLNLNASSWCLGYQLIDEISSEQ